MKTLLLVALFLASLLFPSLTFAQTPTPLRTRNLSQEKVTTRETRFALVRRERIRQYVANMFARLNAAVARLDKLIARMEVRLETFESTKTKDKTKVENELAKAKKLLEATKTDITDAQASAEALLETEDPKQAFDELRGQILSIKKDLVGVHRILVQVIGEMKGLRSGQEE